MAGISDIIEKFLKEMLDNSENGIIEIGRNVLTTRFSSTKGYYIESRRGGSGYIRISTLSNEDVFLNSVIEYLEQNNITFNEGRRIIDRIFELGYITKRERFIILHAISDNSLCVDNKVRDKLRANILLNILYSFGRENE